VFDEEVICDWSGEQAGSEFVIDYVSVSDPATMTVRQEVQDGTWDQDTQSSLPSLRAAPQVIESPPSSPASSQMDADHDDGPVCYHSIWDIMATTAPGEQADDQGDDLLVVNIEESMSFQEAQTYDCWHRAMLDEMTMIESNDT
jgi:hypothetical protein